MSLTSEINHYPLFSKEEGLKKLGSETILKELLVVFVSQSIPEDKSELVTAYANQDWDALMHMAHKIKGGAIYCGAVRLKYACEQVESAKRANQPDSLEKEYKQLLTTLEETVNEITVYLKA